MADYVVHVFYCFLVIVGTGGQAAYNGGVCGMCCLTH